MKLVGLGGPGTGLAIANEEFKVWNRSGGTLAVGDIVMLDMASIDGDTDATADLETGITANVTKPTALGMGGVSGASLGTGNIIAYWFGVVTDIYTSYHAARGTTAGGDNQIIKVLFRGKCDAKFTTDDINIGYPLFPSAGQTYLTLTLAAGNKCIAMAVDDNASAAGLFEVLFNGIEGFTCGPYAN